MNLEKVKEVICDVTELFFRGASVIWSEQTGTKPKPPYITLKLGNINKSAHPIIDENNNRFYPSATILEINVYTKGKPVTAGKAVTGNYANTAASDLMDFFLFLQSDYITDYTNDRGVDIQLIPPVRDLSALENENSAYRYRAMAEATVSFALLADGPYGIGGMPYVPNSSGGGTEEMESEAMPLIDDARVNDTPLPEGGIENEKQST